jgi:ribonuclease E
MANKMLIDATHPEETRVVVVRGNRVEEFDFESASRRQLRGNIYLAKVTRVEPSLQAAFVDYGGNRHGFLAFSEIHPDYYQIPIADRRALIAEEERAQRAADAEVDRRAAESQLPQDRADAVAEDELVEENPSSPEASAGESITRNEDQAARDTLESEPQSEDSLVGHSGLPQAETTSVAVDDQVVEGSARSIDITAADDSVAVNSEAGADDVVAADAVDKPASPEMSGHGEGEAGQIDEAESEDEVVESVGAGDAMEEVPERMPRLRRQYKIQEVIKRRQVMLVQVVKEERGSKGAALTTYLSLAGRYSVLMPNTARGGGISRKITNAHDRKRLKALAQELEVPEGMGVILRTAGANRTKAEIKRDFEYLIRLWETVRDLTLKSTAPTLVYEEGSLIKRSIRDLYNKDIDEVVVAGDDAYREAKEFMRMLMPSHAKNVKPYKDSQPIFTRYGVESQLDAMFSPVVQLRSGGYVVLNQTEALVSIDVNSGRATREHHIEDTALKTNLEASDEIARQLRLRDLAGLIVIDFIDMDEKRNNRAVERRLKECLKNDRARIQVGRISHFGLLEMSRQRIRTGVLESSTEKCPHCGGTGHLRSVSSVALQLLRSIEELLIRGATHNLIVRTRADVALYVLNHKRAHLRELEQRFLVTIMINADATIGGQQSFVIDRGEQVHSLEAARALAAQSMSVAPMKDRELEFEEEMEDGEEEHEEVEELEDEGEEDEGAEESVADVGRKQVPSEAQSGEARTEVSRRRRKRRRRRRELSERPHELGRDQGEHVEAGNEMADAEDGDVMEAPEDAAEGQDESERRRRRRGRRGGRRRRSRDDMSDTSPALESNPDQAGVDLDRPRGSTSAPAEPVTAVSDLEPASQPPVADEHPSALARISARTDIEPAKHRSTVREPVPYYASGETLDASQPAPARDRPPCPASPASSTTSDAMSGSPPEREPEEGERSGQPRRTGWWSRRFAGDKR